jgi:hypothetical protein
MAESGISITFLTEVSEMRNRSLVQYFQSYNLVYS